MISNYTPMLNCNTFESNTVVQNLRQISISKLQRNWDIQMTNLCAFGRILMVLLRALRLQPLSFSFLSSFFTPCAHHFAFIEDRRKECAIDSWNEDSCRCKWQWGMWTQVLVHQSSMQVRDTLENVSMGFCNSCIRFSTHCTFQIPGCGVLWTTPPLVDCGDEVQDSLLEDKHATHPLQC